MSMSGKERTGFKHPDFFSVEYTFLNSVDSFSLSEQDETSDLRRENPHLEFGNPTLAPMIVPVVTITPLPLLYHVCFFIFFGFGSTQVARQLQYAHRWRCSNKVVWQYL